MIKRRPLTLREIDPVYYESYRLLLDLIYNCGATDKDHYKLKDQVDAYIICLLRERPKTTAKSEVLND